MVADVTETRNVIPSLEFKTCMTIKSLYFNFIFCVSIKTKIYHNIFHLLCNAFIYVTVLADYL